MAGGHRFDLRSLEDVDRATIDALRHTSPGGGLSAALDMAEENPTPRIRETLLDLALNGNQELCGRAIVASPIATLHGREPAQFRVFARRRFSRVYGYHVQLKRGHEYDESLEERRADRASLKKYRDSQFPVLDPASARLQRSSR